MFASQASALAVPDLPPPVFADTEVSTNVATRSWTERTRMFNVVLAYDATNRFTAAPAGTEMRKELRFQMRLGADGRPRTLELTDGAAPLAFAGFDLSLAPPDWMFSKDWNLLKVVARGTDEQNEQIVVELTNDAVMLLLR